MASAAVQVAENDIRCVFNIRRMVDRILLNQGVDGETYGNKKGRIRKGFESRLNKDKRDEANWVSGVLGEWSAVSPR